MAEDLFQALIRYHREVVAPDLDQRFAEQKTELRNELLTGLDAVYKRFDRLETEMVMLRGAVTQLERRADAIEQRLTSIDQRWLGVEHKVALRSEITELEERVNEMQQQIEQLKALLNEH